MDNDNNQKLAKVMLVITVILILIGIALLLFLLRSNQMPELHLPEIHLPEIHLPQKEQPKETSTPAIFNPNGTPAIRTPEIVMPSLVLPSVPMPRASAVPSTAPQVTPPPETAYDSVFFGEYEQGNGRAPIEWLVLEEREDSCLLISRQALELMKYHGSDEETTWENCDLREWLNSVFLIYAFTPEEREAILLTEVDNSVGNEIFHVDGGNDTEDFIFLLSREEAKKWFPTEGERLCEPTRAAKTGSIGGYASWWLRTPGYDASLAEYVNFNGAILDGDVDRGFTAVRPALWVSKEGLA